MAGMQRECLFDKQRQQRPKITVAREFGRLGPLPHSRPGVAVPLRGQPGESPLRPYFFLLACLMSTSAVVVDFTFFLSCGGRQVGVTGTGILPPRR